MTAGEWSLFYYCARLNMLPSQLPAGVTWEELTGFAAVRDDIDEMETARWVESLKALCQLLARR